MQTTRNHRVSGRRFVITALVVSALSTNTHSADAPPPEEQATDPMQIARGAQSWAAQCGRCHNMRDPKELRDDQWRAAVSHMRVRAHLTGGEARDILRFLQETNR